MIKGTLIKESISDETILDLITIKSVEIWKSENHTPNQPKYWTAIFFCTDESDFVNQLSQSLKDKWYVDLSNDITKILVFKEKVIEYTIGNKDGRDKAIDYCREIGIPETQIDWED